MFFSFHYQRDVFRASQVRNSWVTKPDRQAAGFWDAAAWEQVKRQGEAAITRWIDQQMEGTSVTVVLIGTQTSQRKYVLDEINQSHVLRKGLLGIYINGLKYQYQQIDMLRGPNPFSGLYVQRAGRQVALSEIYPTYDWLRDNGYENFGTWVEQAARAAGR